MSEIKGLIITAFFFAVLAVVWINGAINPSGDDNPLLFTVLGGIAAFIAVLISWVTLNLVLPVKVLDAISDVFESLDKLMGWFFLIGLGVLLVVIFPISGSIIIGVLIIAVAILNCR